MYSISDVVELGAAHELVLNDIKQILVFDDSEQQTMTAPESFDE